MLARGVTSADMQGKRQPLYAARPLRSSNPVSDQCTSRRLAVNLDSLTAVSRDESGPSPSRKTDLQDGRPLPAPLVYAQPLAQPRQLGHVCIQATQCTFY